MYLMKCFQVSKTSALWAVIHDTTTKLLTTFPQSDDAVKKTLGDTALSQLFELAMPVYSFSTVPWSNEYMPARIKCTLWHFHLCLRLCCCTC